MIQAQPSRFHSFHRFAPEAAWAKYYYAKHSKIAEFHEYAKTTLPLLPNESYNVKSPFCTVARHGGSLRPHPARSLVGLLPA